VRGLAKRTACPPPVFLLQVAARLAPQLSSLPSRIPVVCGAYPPPFRSLFSSYSCPSPLFCLPTLNSTHNHIFLPIVSNPICLLAKESRTNLRKRILSPFPTSLKRKRSKAAVPIHLSPPNHKSPVRCTQSQQDFVSLKLWKATERVFV
jgi:hypothetical protein